MSSCIKPSSRSIFCLLTLLACSALSAGSAEADILLIEDFSYSNGPLGGNGMAAGGWTGSWTNSTAQVVDGRGVLTPGSDDAFFSRDFAEIPGLGMGDSRYIGIDVTIVNNTGGFPRFSMNINGVSLTPGSIWGLGT